MKKKIAIIAGAMLVLVLAGYYLWGPAKTPPGQHLLTKLSAANFADFEAAFDSAADGPRLVILVSPT
ncbi:MAG TPA: hypothetical protein VGZ48_14155 [Candidatus Acidoferrales bacterium]|jgi:hypothetical protein|nr:hypothetical protein [Candidatus Acidoferrales bacterium]